MATAEALTQTGTPPSSPKPGVSAVEMGARQREISVSEFFAKNRHLLGFDNPRKALLTCRQGGGGQLARRLRGGRHPARRP